MLTDDIKNISSEIFEKMIRIRKEIHKHPELGFQEFKTSSLIAQTLDDMGLIAKTNIAQTGVTGLLKCGDSCKTIAIRADMDALPILETNLVDYASTNKGMMHACGHDAHIAIVLGAAEILNKLKHKINGNIKFLFQPGEEGFGGAKHMIEEGVLKNPAVDAIIATHVSPLLTTDQISIRAGETMAMQNEFHITIKGKGGHAAQPHDTIDPIIIGMNLANLFQTIITKEKNPVKNALLSITSFNAGNTSNIVPETASIRGTVRSFDPHLSKYILDRMESMTALLTQAMRADYEFHIKEGYPVLINHKKMVDQIITSASKMIPPANIFQNVDPVMLAEDFAFFAQTIPAAMFNLGCKNQTSCSVSPLHSSSFNIDEACIKTGMQIMAQTAIDYLDR